MLEIKRAELEVRVKSQEAELEKLAREKQSIEADSLLGRETMQNMQA